MGGKRHKGISMNRAKKKFCLLVPAVEEPEEPEEPEEVEEPAQQPGVGPSKKTEPEPAPEPEPEHPPDTRSGTLAVVSKLHARVLDAKLKYLKVRRRWERKKHYLFDEKHSLLRHKSEVKRDEARLAQTETPSSWMQGCTGSRARPAGAAGGRSTCCASAISRTQAIPCSQASVSAPSIQVVCDACIGASQLQTVAWGGSQLWKEWNDDHFGLVIAYGLEYSDRL